MNTLSPIKLSGKNQTLASVLYGTDVPSLSKRIALFRADPNIIKISDKGDTCQCAEYKGIIRITEYGETFVFLAWQIHCVICEPLQYALLILGMHLLVLRLVFGCELMSEYFRRRALLAVDFRNRKGTEAKDWVKGTQRPSTVHNEEYDGVCH